MSVLALLLIAGVAVWMGRRPSADSGESSPEASVQSGRSEGRATAIRSVVESGEERVLLTEELAEIQNEPDFKEWPGLLLDLMQAASLDEVQALLVASDGELGESAGFRDEMKAAAYERWFALDPVGALRAIDESTMSPQRKVHVMEVFLDEWSGRAPDQVLAFLQEGELKGLSIDQAYGAVVRGASLAGVIELVDAALSRIADAKLHSYAVRAAARNLQRDHDSRFEGWLASLPAAHQGAALAESAWILSEEKIDRALVNLERLEQVEAERVPVTRSRVVVKWAEDDPVKAAEWVAKQDLQGEAREALFANVLSVWFSDDQAEATNWVEALIARGEIDEDFMNRVATRL